MTENSEHLTSAVDWYIKLTAEDASPEDHQAWMVWMNQSQQNAAAWEEIKSTLNTFKSIPSDIGMSVLNRNKNKVDLSRRATLKNFVIFAAISLPVGLLIHEELTPEFEQKYLTKVGERKHVLLADGSRIILNTNSVITVNLTKLQRSIQLHQGEMLITTGHAHGFDSPLLIETPDGHIEPMGTRFNVRKFDTFTRVSLFEGMLKVRSKDNDVNFYVHPQEQVDIYAMGVVSSPTQWMLSDAWSNGYVEVNDVPLQTLINELARYKQGLLLCHPDIKDLRVSGTYSIDDIDASLNGLTQTFPVRIQRATRFLTMVLPDV